MARFDAKVDPVAREATIAVDVGDVTLVSEPVTLSKGTLIYGCIILLMYTVLFVAFFKQWASLCLSLQGGSRTLYSEHLGTMGYGLCAGIAAVLAKPSPAAAVVLAGDGGFQMTLQELATFQQMKRPGDKLICIVFFDS